MRNPTAELVDLHHHAFPPAYLSALLGMGITGEGGLSSFPRWDPGSDLEMMDRQGIAAAILSVSAPGVYFDDIGLARRLARTSNEWIAGTVRAHPSRFGGLAVLPLPDVDASLTELAFALDELELEGVCLLTSVGDFYLGDALFDPLLEELDRRRAVVFVHPREPSSSRHARLALPPTTVEYVFDTTRAVASLMFSGSLERFPNIAFVLSHAGGAVPFLAWRLAIGLEAKQPPFHDTLVHALERVTHRYGRDVLDEGTRGLELLRNRFHYDTALSATPFALSALQALVGPDRIVFGSDAPFAPEFIVAESVKGLWTHGRFDAAGRHAVARGNAIRLFPKFAARMES